MDRLIDLQNYGQSYWLDNLTRKKIANGELKRRVDTQDLRGVTSNPDIFNKAITGSTDYDEQIIALAKTGYTPAAIYDALTIKDIRDACDILKPVYDRTGGTDGFVSLEVSPFLAYDTRRTMEEARRLFHAVGRANCMIKIPGTREGVAAIEQALYEGININITLLFSVERYTEVADAYIHALWRRLREGKPVSNIHSVASVFISRIDTLVDELLGQRIDRCNENDNGARLLPGKAGIATARLTYERFQKLFWSEHWKMLERKGALVQRPLWASTSTKNPLYNELLYVESLIGYNTVNTLPDRTIAAFAARGVFRKNTIGEDLAEAKQLFAKLQQAGIEMNYITAQLEQEGVQKFIAAYNQLISNLALRRQRVLAQKIPSQEINGGKPGKELQTLYAALDERQTARRLFERDPYLWTSEPARAATISHALGWLALPRHFSERVQELNDFTADARKNGFTDAVLLGMGGSSLCSEVARRTFDPAEGYLRLHVLDNTSPEAVLDLRRRIDPARTLFLVASKSGATQETICFFRYFYYELEKSGSTGPGAHFVAITDYGTPLAKMAEEFKFRRLFLNPSDVGGRYSVLSCFGLLPMALMGIDLDAILEGARLVAGGSDSVPAAANPPVSLGAFLGFCAKQGRDKVTFVLSPGIRPFGYWVEQLIAESTGKEGRGLVPVNGEPVGAPDVYGADRVFVHLFLPADDNKADHEKLRTLEEAGHPVVRIKLPNRLALGAEYYRWEIAVAIAGMVIGINPFNQPNVEESKQNTRMLLGRWSRNRSADIPEPAWKLGNISVHGGKKTGRSIGSHIDSPEVLFEAVFNTLRPGSYVALLPYFLLTEQRSSILQRWREQIRDDWQVATTLLGGPRYLHSTGQLHKGGPGTGTFLLLTGGAEEDLPVPGETFGFKTLQRAQAFGDFRSLDEKGRNVLLLDLGGNIDAALEQLSRPLEKLHRHYAHLHPER